MSNTIFRVGTANMYDNAIRNVSARQTSLVNLQENLTSGKRVVRASDDPVSAAQAERALTRISRIQTEQRALENQRNAIALGESTLGDAVEVIQSFRELVVRAGGGSLTPNDRATIANQLQSLRDQLQDVANRKDPNGIPLLSALGSAVTPFEGSPSYGFKGSPGQQAPTGVTLPGALDGHAAFMFDPQRDGIYTADVTVGQLITSPITPLNTNTVTGGSYTITFGPLTAGATTGTSTISYTLTASGLTPAPPPLNVPVPDFPTGKPLNIGVTSVPGLSFEIKGTPASGDTITLQPSASLFNTLDKAINGIRNSNNAAATQAVGQALANIDAGLERIQNLRGYAGELLNRADRITGDQEKRFIELEADRSRAEDLDMIKGISDFQNQQTGYQAALQTYASVQKLSLFNYIG